MNMQALFFSAQGRINRKPYWMGLLMLLGFEIVASLVLGAVIGMSGAGTVQLDGSTAMTGGSMVVMGLGAIVYLVVLVMSLMLAVKRVHDRDRSGWFLLLALLPLLNIWVFIEVGFLPGTPGPNRFGPDPLPRVASPYLAA